MELSELAQNRGFESHRARVKLLVMQFLAAGMLALVGLVAVGVAVKRSEQNSMTPGIRRRTVTRKGTFPGHSQWLLRSYPIALGTIRADERRRPETLIDG